MYKVICEKCNGESLVEIAETQQGKLINWRKIGTVISGRERLDMQLGWQCYCGNNSIMSSQEKKYIENPAQPTPKEITDIVKNLKVESTHFRLVEA